jgi:2-(1,2-epoxy-1,2-dihydrophenyl)acetyl-CoA isomerase
MSDVLEVTDDRHVRTIRLNRPEVKNAINLDLAWSIVSEVELAASDDDVWVIAITGRDGAFCSGLDLRGSGEDASPQTAAGRYLDDLGWPSQFPLVFRQQCEKPIVCGLNGVAVGAGLSLALACDIRLMARGARILAGYPRIGGSPDGGMTFTLSQLIGYERTMRFLLESATVDADEALALGIVGEVVDADRFEDRLTEYCQQLARVSPITSRLTKRTVVKATTAIDLEAQLRLEIVSIGKAFGSRDGKEARAAFLEKREPKFEGR